MEGKYFWVKRTPFHEYEPAKCTDRYKSDSLWFEFTDGEILAVHQAHDFKELINPFNT